MPLSASQPTPSPPGEYSEPPDAGPGALPLGAVVQPEGVRFRLFSRHARAVELCIFERPDSARAHRTVELRHLSGGVWQAFLPGAGPGLLYGYRVHGPWAPGSGHLFNPSKLLIDPYALAVTGEPRADVSLFGHSRGRSPLDSFDSSDSAGAMPKCVVVDPGFDRQGVEPPRVPWGETVLYEVHVKGATRLHPEVPEELRGTFGGLAHPAFVEHLKDLGVTSLGLMPVHQGASEAHLLERGLRNYWGYSPLAFFAPTSSYASGGLGEQVREFQRMVRELHRQGLEVLVDVVYNHTAEGGLEGPIYSWKGIDNATYYRLHPHRRSTYLDITGCGNTLDIRQEPVLDLVLGSLRYWIEVLGVDGFRFDLAPVLGRDGDRFSPRARLFEAIVSDPVLRRAKWIAEPWDLGPDGYQLGGFPPPWAQWNDRFRDTARRFWRGEAGGAVTAELAMRITGSEDVFAPRGPLAGVSYVVSHDGFTLRDLVSYERKRNEANGEGGRDGTGNNLSRNWGVEGPTGDTEVRDRRARARRNILATMLLSHGIPMLCHGDELGRTQRGNNNPYCQDNEITWTDWTDPDRELVEYVRHLIALRRRFPLLRRGRYPSRRTLGSFSPGESPPGDARRSEAGICWLGADGSELSAPAWGDPGLRGFAAVYLPGRYPEALEEPATETQAQALILLVNGGDGPIRFRFPPPIRYRPMSLLLDTSLALTEEQPFEAPEACTLEGLSQVLLAFRLPEESETSPSSENHS